MLATFIFITKYTIQNNKKGGEFRRYILSALDKIIPETIRLQRAKSFKKQISTTNAWNDLFHIRIKNSLGNTKKLRLQIFWYVLWYVLWLSAFG